MFSDIAELEEEVASLPGQKRSAHLVMCVVVSAWCVLMHAEGTV